MESQVEDLNVGKSHSSYQIFLLNRTYIFSFSNYLLQQLGELMYLGI